MHSTSFIQKKPSPCKTQVQDQPLQKPDWLVNPSTLKKLLMLVAASCKLGNSCEQPQRPETYF